jgi:hypothetical protein
LKGMTVNAMNLLVGYKLNWIHFLGYRQSLSYIEELDKT